MVAWTLLRCAARSGRLRRLLRRWAQSGQGRQTPPPGQSCQEVETSNWQRTPGKKTPEEQKQHARRVPAPISQGKQGRKYSSDAGGVDPGVHKFLPAAERLGDGVERRMRFSIVQSAESTGMLQVLVQEAGSSTPSSCGSPIAAASRPAPAATPSAFGSQGRSLDPLSPCSLALLLRCSQRPVREPNCCSWQVEQHRHLSPGSQDRHHQINSFPP